MSRATFFSGLMAAACGILVHGQAVPPPPAATQRVEFDVASVKPNKGGPESGFSVDFAPSGRVIFRNVSLWNLIRNAYGVRDLQMSGPAWTKDRRFDILAQAPQSAAPVPREQALRMLQTLLEDRFRLKWHNESREGPAYALTVAARGPKLPPPHEGVGQTMFGDLDTPGMTIDSLCQILQFDLDRPVLDRTGLAGPFAIKLQWASQRARAAAPSDATPPSLLTAVTNRNHPKAHRSA